MKWLVKLSRFGVDAMEVKPVLARMAAFDQAEPDGAGSSLTTALFPVVWDGVTPASLNTVSRMVVEASRTSSGILMAGGGEDPDDRLATNAPQRRSMRRRPEATGCSVSVTGSFFRCVTTRVGWFCCG